MIFRVSITKENEPSFLYKLASKVTPSIASTTLVLVVFLIMLPFYLDKMVGEQIDLCIIILAVILFSQIVTVAFNSFSDFWRNFRRTNYKYPNKTTQTSNESFNKKIEEEVQKAVERMKRK